MQKQWSFVDPFGQRHFIGFFHGHDSGHFLMYVNDKISVIDFNIKDDKSYSFVIGQRLLQLTIKKEGASFEYDLKDQTPVPEQPAWAKIRDLTAAAVMVGLLGFVLVNMTYFLWQVMIG